jgi:hypothetical protein
MRWLRKEIPKIKFQIPKKKQIPNKKIPNSKIRTQMEEMGENF